MVLALAALLAGCAARPQSAPQTGSGARPAVSSPTQRYNLTGYSAAFKQGYADACASPRRRDESRLKSDNDYSMGWTDGSSVCRAR
jgi:hypothetical protein